jgi:ribonuclease Z
MQRLIFLGTGAALPSPSQDNSSLLIESKGTYLMIDCSGIPYRKLLQVGANPALLRHILITHHHIDHVGGLPSLIESLWIKGRSEPLHIYALPQAMQVIEVLLDLWDLRQRPIKAFPIILHTIQGKPDELVIDSPEFILRTTPTIHAVPSVASKIIFPDGQILVYSSDTAPSQAFLDFARGTDYLMMECTYCDKEQELAGITYHLTPASFSKIANQIQARHTLLIHHSELMSCSHAELTKEITQNHSFKGNFSIPKDLDVIEIN